MEFLRFGQRKSPEGKNTAATCQLARIVVTSKTKEGEITRYVPDPDSKAFHKASLDNNGIARPDHWQFRQAYAKHDGKLIPETIKEVTTYQLGEASCRRTENQALPPISTEGVNSDSVRKKLLADMEFNCQSCPYRGMDPLTAAEYDRAVVTEELATKELRDKGHLPALPGVPDFEQRLDEDKS